MIEQDYRVERQDSATGGRYVIRIAPGVDGEMTYRRLGPGIIAIDHTGVPRQFRGRGFAEMLVKAGIADARAEGTRIVPLCSFVAAQFRRHPEWEDLRAT